MREIKFRAWDKHSESMNFINPREPDGYNISAIASDKHWNVMQYTGLKDKSGKEIYEGDILKWSGGRITEITWHEYSASFDCRPLNDLGIPRPLSDRQSLFSEIIGNIYQHKHLLGE